MDNKSIKNHRKIASSSYPPRSSSDENVHADYLFPQCRLYFSLRGNSRTE
jgi:hypothetical protein